MPSGKRCALKMFHTLKINEMKYICGLALMLVVGCSQKISEDGGAAMEKVSFQTEDGVTIVANYWKGSSTGVLLLHMMPATRESWNQFAQKLSSSGMSVLAIDLRGHGESVKQDGRILDYTKFTDQQHQSSIFDVEAAASYLKEKGITELFIAGASIGANLALEYQAEHSDVKRTIVLSPGTNYRGVVTEPYAERLLNDQEVFFVAATRDAGASGAADAMAKQIASHVKGRKEVKIYDSENHGTDLFNDYPMLIDVLAEWLIAKR